MLTTVPAVKDRLKIDRANSSVDVLLLGMIVRASAAIEEFAGRFLSEGGRVLLERGRVLLERECGPGVAGAPFHPCRARLVSPVFEAAAIATVQFYFSERVKDRRILAGPLGSITAHSFAGREARAAIGLPLPVCKMLERELIDA